MPPVRAWPQPGRITTPEPFPGPHPWADPMFYGAQGDGLSDDSTGFQEAVNVAARNGAGAGGLGGYVLLGAYSFKIGASLTVPSNVTFISLGATLSGVGAASVTPIINYGTPGAPALSGPLDLAVRSITVLSSSPYVPSAAVGTMAGIHIDNGGAVFHIQHPTFGAKADGQQVTDGAITTGTAILTSASGRFVVADVGKLICVALAGGASPTPLNTTILSFQSSTQVTLAANASTTVSGATVTWGTDDSTAINAAITAASISTDAGVVLLPASIICHASSIVPKTNVTLQGAGAGAAILKWIGATNSQQIANPSPSVGVQLQNCNFFAFKLDASSTPGVDNMLLKAWFQSRMRDIWFYATNGTTATSCGLRIECPNGTSFLDNASNNTIEAIRITSTNVAIQLSGFGVNGGIVTNNDWFGVVADDVIVKGIRLVQWCDTNYYYGITVSYRSAANVVGVIYNDSATPNANAGVYNEHFVGLSCNGSGDGNQATQVAVRFNFTSGNRIQGFWTGIGVAGQAGTMIDDTNGGTNAQSYLVELLSASSAYASSKSISLTKGYGFTRSVQTPAFAANYTPDPTAGEIIAMTLTAGITVNAPTLITTYRGQMLTFIFTQGNGGGWGITWDARFGTAAFLSAALNRVTTVSFINIDGTQNGWRQYQPSAIDDAGNLVLLGSLNVASSFISAGTSITATTHLKSGKATPAYSASITPDASAGNWQTITVTNGTAFTINAPTNPPGATATESLTIEILNSSGGAMGVITWNGAFLFPGLTWANPASTKKRSATFRWNGVNWVGASFTGADY